MTRILIVVLEYITWWLPIFCLSLPIIWAFVYHYWYFDYKKRQNEARWKRLGEFFARNADKYPEAAGLFGLAKFWESKEGYDTMHTIKKAEYYK